MFRTLFQFYVPYAFFNFMFRTLFSILCSVHFFQFYVPYAFFQFYVPYTFFKFMFRTLFSILCSVHFFKFYVPYTFFKFYVPYTFFRKSCRLWDNAEKYCRAGQDTDDNMIPRMRFACWINKVTDTHPECVILAAFNGNSVYAITTQCYVMLHALPVVLVLQLYSTHTDHCTLTPSFTRLFLKSFFALASLANIRHLFTSSHFRFMRFWFTPTFFFTNTNRA
jgi:hypothetical protein